MNPLTVDVWSDIACPWCHVGKRRLESALACFAHRDDVRVCWRAFELKPDAPPVESSDVPYLERLASKYRTTKEQAQEMLDRMTEVAAGEGLHFHFDRIQPGNTFDAHRLLHLAAEHKRQDALKERLLRAYLEEGEPIGDPSTLQRLAVQACLPADEVESVLNSDRFATEVRREEQEAQELGIHGVPFFLIGRRYAVSGAQPSNVLLAALQRAWGDRSSSESYSEGAVCGPDGCG
jgi:predicted DsbA family dithiol-disulfide isomerase